VGSNKARRARKRANKGKGWPEKEGDIKVLRVKPYPPSGRKREYRKFFQRIEDLFLQQPRVENVEPPPPHSPGHEND
jgi:hypothetical protein